MHHALVWGISCLWYPNLHLRFFTWLLHPFCKFLCQYEGLLSLVLRCRPCNSAGTCGKALLLSNFGCKGFFSNLFLIGGSIAARGSDLGKGARKTLIRGSIMHFLISSSKGGLASTVEAFKGCGSASACFWNLYGSLHHVTHTWKVANRPTTPSQQL